MKERPILFSAPMVRAILEGRKTQTRRVVKPQLHNAEPTYGCLGGKGFGWFYGNDFIKCPYGKIGDRLWVRESFTIPDCITCDQPSLLGKVHTCAPLFKATDAVSITSIRWRPSIHMPRWASRITLEITGIRVERLQDISEDDAKAEGVYQYKDGAWKIYTPTTSFGSDSAKRSFNTLWESINGAESWDANPWVWVVEFKRVEK